MTKCMTLLFRTPSTLTALLRTKYWSYFLIVVALSYSGLGLLSLCLRTQYQISHTVGRLFPVAASSPTSRNSSCLSHWGYSWATQAPLFSYAQKCYCHTTCPIGLHSIKVPEHSLQSLWPGLTQSVPQTQNTTCWGSCQLQSWVQRWMWMQE